MDELSFFFILAIFVAILVCGMVSKKVNKHFKSKSKIEDPEEEEDDLPDIDLDELESMPPMSEEEEEEYQSEHGYFPSEGEEVEWDHLCDTCYFFSASVHWQDSVWRGYCTFDNNPMEPSRKLNTDSKCAIGKAISLNSNPDEKDKKGQKSIKCDKCGKYFEDIKIITTNSGKPWYRLETIGLFCLECSKVEGIKNRAITDIEKEFREKYYDPDEW